MRLTRLQRQQLCRSRARALPQSCSASWHPTSDGRAYGRRTLYREREEVVGDGLHPPDGHREDDDVRQRPKDQPVAPHAQEFGPQLRHDASPAAAPQERLHA
eukprot:scaffold9394_cov124-Isochrysis_galbana.AAC.4